MDALSNYFAETGENVSTFAVRIGRAPSTLSRVLSGQRDPSIDLARDVERGTGGLVSKLQFLEICLAAQSPSAPVKREAVG